MATVRTLLERALRKSGILSEGDPASPELIADALDELKNTAGTWNETEGIPNQLASATYATTVREPATVYAAMVYAVAEQMADEVRVPVARGVTRKAAHYKQLAQGLYLNDLRMRADPALTRRHLFDIDEVV